MSEQCSSYYMNITELSLGTIELHFDTIHDFFLDTYHYSIQQSTRLRRLDMQVGLGFLRLGLCLFLAAYQQRLDMRLTHPCASWSTASSNRLLSVNVSPGRRTALVATTITMLLA
jgi:hypothetical protein